MSNRKIPVLISPISASSFSLFVPGPDRYSRIAKDKIGDVSVKLQFSQEDAWTRALRHVLLALKILLKWATSGSNA